VVEATGFKGTSVGDAQVSTKHANFIVNQGQASASDVLSLIKKIRTGIVRKTGIKLELELKIVGEV
ncbi:MAG: UDP-N-acetylenolpyruvoylglucosamine reductase, partial [Nitrospira sp.]